MVIEGRYHQLLAGIDSRPRLARYRS